MTGSSPAADLPTPIQQRYTNEQNIPLILAVFLAQDDYDYDPKAISATALLKSVRQTVLKRRVKPEDSLIDVSMLVKSRTGSALHDAVEKVWMGDFISLMLQLGYPEEIANRIRVNPDPEGSFSDKDIDIYIEQRFKRTLVVDGKEYVISGKPDFICNGGVQDLKSTTTVTHRLSDKDEDYLRQCSIYRWLRPDLITRDYLQINFMFNDWFAGRAKADPSYPQSSCIAHKLPLLSLDW